ncbi:MAG: biotin/lipoyl-containing protein [Ilumatobacteraceae bacterium]
MDQQNEALRMLIEFAEKRRLWRSNQRFVIERFSRAIDRGEELVELRANQGDDDLVVALVTEKRLFVGSSVRGTIEITEWPLRSLRSVEVDAQVAGTLRTRFDDELLLLPRFSARDAELLRVCLTKRIAVASAPKRRPSERRPVTDLEMLESLQRSGVLTPQEYSAVKARLLQRIAVEAAAKSTDSARAQEPAGAAPRERASSDEATDPRPTDTDPGSTRSFERRSTPLRLRPRWSVEDDSMFSRAPGRQPRRDRRPNLSHCERLGLTTVVVYAEDDASAPHVPGQLTRRSRWSDGEPLPIDVSVSSPQPERHPGRRSTRDTDCRQRTAGVLRRLRDGRDRIRRAECRGPWLLGDKTTALTACAAGAQLLASTGPGLDIARKPRLPPSWPRRCIDDAQGRRRRRRARHAAGPARRRRGSGLRDVSQRGGALAGDSVVRRAQFCGRARHVEVQTIDDRHGVVRVLGDRDCSVQRRHQKMIEFGPAPWLDASTRTELHDVAARIAEQSGIVGVATMEFLVPVDGEAGGPFFLECNPRLQVEHTVTEAVTGLDLVELQLEMAAGASRADVLATVPASVGRAVQLRVCAERYDEQGSPALSSGRIERLALPGGPGIRIDGVAEVGLAPNPNYDSLVAKLIVHTSADSHDALLRKARRAISEFVVTGVGLTTEVLGAALAHPDLRSGQVSTRWLEAHPEVLTAERVADPLAVLGAGRREEVRRTPALPEGHVAVASPVPGTIVRLECAVGTSLDAGATVAVLESMKMEHLVTTDRPCVVTEVAISPGDTVGAGDTLVVLRPTGDARTATDPLAGVDLDAVRPDLAEVVERHAYGYDEHRPDAVAKRRRTGQRTARENIEDLVDDGSLVEYAPLVVAAQRRRRELQDLIERTPGDGRVGGIGRVNGEQFGPERSRAVVMTYDYTVLAGTQGHQNHRKKDRLFELAERLRLPVVLFAEGGGGRPGDTDRWAAAASTAWPSGSSAS